MYSKNSQKDDFQINSQNKLISSSNFKNYLEFYTRYKSILKDFLRDTIIFIKQSQRKII